MVSCAPFCDPFNSEHLACQVDATAGRASNLLHRPYCYVIYFSACFFDSSLLLWNVLNEYGPDIRDFKLGNLQAVYAFRIATSNLSFLNL